MVLEKIPESPLDCKEINLSILKEINPDYSLEGLMLKVKLQYFGHLMRRAYLLEKGMLGKTECKRRREWQRMRWLDSIIDSIHSCPCISEHEFEQIPGGSGGQRSLGCCSPRDGEQSDKT